MRQMESAEKTKKSKNSLIKLPGRQSMMKLAVALKSKGVDLRRGRAYRVLPDKKAKAEGYVRVVDGSGEDYLYPESYFSFFSLSTDQALKLFP